MTLDEFMSIVNENEKERDSHTTFVMIKIIEAVERDAESGRYNSYSPSHIHLHNFDPASLDRLTVKFGTPIVNKNNQHDVLYLAPELLGGSISTKKSVVFCLGAILDEMIHGSMFFRSI